MQFFISKNHPSLPGHFPGSPVVPGVVILERVLASLPQQSPSTYPLLLSWVKFLLPLLPEQRATIDWEEHSMRRTFRVYHQEALIVVGQLVRQETVR